MVDALILKFPSYLFIYDRKCECIIVNEIEIEPMIPSNFSSNYASKCGSHSNASKKLHTVDSAKEDSVNFERENGGCDFVNRKTSAIVFMDNTVIYLTLHQCINIQLSQNNTDNLVLADFSQQKIWCC